MRLPPAITAVCGAVMLALGISRADEPGLRLCADEWMPFNGGAEAESPGYVIELARAIFTPRGIAVTYTVMPWEDALSSVREGRMDAAIGANTAEAEGLLVPAEAIGKPPTCLMTLADSRWSYDNVLSFRGVKLGVIKDYSYWPNLDAYIEKQAGKGVVLVEGDAPLDDLMAQLTEGKVDVIAESEPVLLWHLRAHGVDRNRFRVVYKHEAEAIYLAFAHNDSGRKHAAIFDEGMRAMRASGDLEKVLRRYGLRDWQ